MILKLVFQMSTNNFIVKYRSKIGFFQQAKITIFQSFDYNIRVLQLVFNTLQILEFFFFPRKRYLSPKIYKTSKVTSFIVKLFILQDPDVKRLLKF